MLEARTGRLVNEQPPSLFAQHTDRFIVDDDDMDSNTVAESDMSLKSRPLLHRVNDRLRKMLDQSLKHERCNTRQQQTFFRVENLYVFDIGSICIHGKQLLKKLRSIRIAGNNLTMKPMFDIFEKLIVGQSDENDGVNTINWVDSSWKHFYLVGEEVITLSHAKVYVFSDSVLCLGKLNEIPLSNTVWEDKLTKFKSSPQF